MQKWYRVDQQCCPGKNCKETPLETLELLVIPTKYTKIQAYRLQFKVEFCIYGWNYQ